MLFSGIDITKSLANCHAVGLDSIVLKPGPGMVRLFVAREDHELWKNQPCAGMPFSIGLHRHHCDVTLIPIVGDVFNVSGVAGGWPVFLTPYPYSSGVTGKGAFTEGGVGSLAYLQAAVLNGPTFLPATDLHTIEVPRGQAAAWIVWEGREVPDHAPTTWSNHDLTRVDFSALYQPMTEERLHEDLAIIGVKGNLWEC